MAKTHTFWFVTCLVIVQITAMAEDISAEALGRPKRKIPNLHSIRTTPEKVPDTDELFNRRFGFQKQTESFAMKGHTVTKFNYPTRNWGGTMYESFDIRNDGSRNKSIKSLWGDVSVVSPNVKEEDAHYHSRLYDSKDKYSYSRGAPSTLGMLMISNMIEAGLKMNEMNLEIGTAPGQISGFHRGDLENIKELVLNRSQKLEVRNTMLSIRGNKCYVIDAVVKDKGTYTLWIDPKHDYHISRVQVKRKSGDHIYKNQLKEGDYSNEVFEVVKYEKVGEFWYPKECRLKIDKVRYGHPSKEEKNITYSEISFNPDHENLESFGLTDIPNGTPTRLTAFPSNIDFIWQDGRVLDKNGNEVDPQKAGHETKEIEKSSSTDRKHPTALAENISAPVNASEVMLKFVESQKKIKSYIIKSNSKSTFSYTGVAPFNGRGTIYRHSDVRFDGDRVKESVTSWGDVAQIKNLAKEHAVYISTLWDGEAGYELSLRDKIRRHTSKYPGSVQIRKEKGGTDYIKETYKRTTISPAQGYVMGNDQDIGIMFLRADAKVKLYSKRSKVNGVDCYVIEAEVPKRGKYKVWIDPVHGFNLARLQSRRKTGDIVNRRPLNKDTCRNDFYEVLEFQEVGGVWLPKTFKTKSNGHDGSYDYDERGVTQTKLYEVDLDPDHDKEGSFLTDDILNGTQVLLEGRLTGPEVIVTWQDGKIVTNVLKQK